MLSNIEYIHKFAEKHNFPKTECEVVFNTIDDGKEVIYANECDIISVKFDKTLVENEIKIDDIRFDVDSEFPEDVFFEWQKDDPEVSFKEWIVMGRYMPAIIKNSEFFDELDTLTKEIEMKMESIFSNIENGEDSDFEEDEEYKEGEN